MHPSAQAVVTDTVPTVIETSPQSQIVDALLLIIGALLTGGFAIVGGFIYSLYKSVPVAFQSAFLDVMRGIVATLSETARKQAESAKDTGYNLDDRIWGSVLEALDVFGVNVEKVEDTPPIDDKPKDGI